MEKKELNDFVAGIMNDVNSSMRVLNLYIGHKLGLFKALDETGPATDAELADHTAYNQRYIREWLECMVANNILEYDSKSGEFNLPDGLSEAFLDENSPNYIAPFLCWAPGLAGVVKPLMEAFATGEGIPYEAYGEDALEAIGMGNKPMFVNDLAGKWIPTMVDVNKKLEAGGRIADIGCGVGWSSITLAEGFPNSIIDALDPDNKSIEIAKENAKDKKVDSRITFHRASAEDSQLEGPYDLITVFEVLHDMAYPVEALKEIRKLVFPEGSVLIADEAASDALEESKNFLGSFFYNFSVLHCLPQSMVYPDSAATGTVIGPKKVEEYAKEAGFSKVTILPINNPFWRFYHLEP